MHIEVHLIDREGNWNSQLFSWKTRQYEDPTVGLRKNCKSKEETLEETWSFRAHNDILVHFVEPEFVVRRFVSSWESIDKGNDI